MRTTIEMAREAAGDDWGLFQEYMPEIHKLTELVRADERARMAEQPKGRPVESDYASQVAYTRALEEYCDGLAEQPAQQEPVAWQYRDANDDGTWSAWLGCDKRLVEDEYRQVRALFTSPQPAPVQQEPVAVVSGYYGGQCVILPIDPARIFNSNTALYTTPPAQHTWVGLTDEAIWLEYQKFWPFHPAEEPTLAKDIAKFAKAIEAKLRSKNEDRN